MNHMVQPSTSKQEDIFEDDEIFDDSTFLANFDKTFGKQTKASGSNVYNTSPVKISPLCCNEEIKGYDRDTGESWIYPTNYPVRDYQFNITQAALFKNTLVSLPTGLGKTFIAAVVIYNFYRWYPVGKIVFTAPTRPLVAQQIDACYNIIGIPPADTIEMTGHMQVNARKTNWQNKRIFFATPQVIYNDIKSGICPADKIRCLVMDEAHKARGNYAYCQIVAKLDEMGHKTYRILALSATPGSKVEDVINVVRSLHIAHLELRSENCIDVAPYRHSRKINTVIIELGAELTRLRNQYVEILDGYARRLKQFNILPQNLGNLSKGRIVMLYKEFQNKERGARHPQHNYIMRDFNLLITLFHGLELLVKHGSRVFLNFFDEHPEKSWMHADDRLTALLERLREDLGIDPMSLDRSILPDGTIPEMPKDLCFGHPKFDKLKSIIMEHFTSAKEKNQDTRAIIFCEYRDSVSLVHCLLLQCRPLVAPQMFVGQGASPKDGKTVISQKEQLRVMRQFREGACNALVATAVAEEGLDVGAVDLIVCFDISTRSPIRLVQRCGRTGRERGGQVHILVTEGREHQTLMDCMRQRDGLNKNILHSKEVENNLYKANPRMVPLGFTPTCRKMYILVDKKRDSKEAAQKSGKKAANNPRKSMKKSKASLAGSSTPTKDIDNLYTDEDKNLFSMFKCNGAIDKATKNQKVSNISDVNLASTSGWLTTSPKGNERHLPTQKLGIDKPELPSQNILASTIQKQTKKKQKVPLTNSPAKMNGDIRALFSKTTKSTKSYTKLINDLGLQNNSNISTQQLDLLIDLKFNIEDKSDEGHCYICQNIYNCKSLLHQRKPNDDTRLTQFLNKPVFLDLGEVGKIDVNTIKQFLAVPEPSQEPFDIDIRYTTICEDEQSDSFNLELDYEALEEIQSPKSPVQEKADIDLDNFGIDNLDELLAEISSDELAQTPEKFPEKTEQLKEKENTPITAKEALDLENSIDDIFADYMDDFDEESVKTSSNNQGNSSSNEKEHQPIAKGPEKLTREKSPQLSKNIYTKNVDDNNASTSECPLSPSILSGKLKIRSNPTSPILCSQKPRSQFKARNMSLECSTPNSTAKRKLSLPGSENLKQIATEDKHDQNTTSKSVLDKTDKSMFTVTQLVEMINKNFDNSVNHSKINSSRNLDKRVNEDEERSASPILWTQADRKCSTNINRSKNDSKSQHNRHESVIILDSDDDSNDTIEYEVDKEMSKPNTNIVYKTTPSQESKTTQPIKRKFADQDSSSASPYFNKKPKLETSAVKPLTIQEKVLAAVASNKTKSYKNNQINFHCTVTQPPFAEQKENITPKLDSSKNHSYFADESKSQKISDTLQKYKKESKLQTLRSKFDSVFAKTDKQVETPTEEKISKENDVLQMDEKFSPVLNKTRSPNIDASVKRKKSFDSDDDFMEDIKINYYNPKKTLNRSIERATTPQKPRKKKRERNNPFIEIEASLSEGWSDSGDEMSDGSVGSVAHFICDDDTEGARRADMHAIYVKSIRSPVKKNGFKIPQLPNKFKKEDVLSQFVEEDTYEMDSFCVDSHIELTQANDISELELAEMILEKNRRAKKKAKRRSPSPQENEGSPLVRRLNKKCNRQINSDSDDSS